MKTTERFAKANRTALLVGALLFLGGLAVIVVTQAGSAALGFSLMLFGLAAPFLSNAFLQRRSARSAQAAQVAQNEARRAAAKVDGYSIDSWKYKQPVVRL